MTDRRIQTALVGYGLAGEAFHAPFLRFLDQYTLVKVASRRPERVRASLPGVQVVASPDELWRDPAIELAVIVAPNRVHGSLIRDALNAGKHVVVDKPFVPSVAEAVELAALARARGRVLSVYQNRRWDGDFLTVQDLVTGDHLGPIRYFESHMDRYRPEVRDRWSERSEPGAGLLYGLGSHLIDQALVLFGWPQAVSARVLAQRPGAVIDDYFHVILHYAQCEAVLHAGSVVVAPTPRFQIHGDRGSYVKYGVDSQESALRAGGGPGRPGHQPWGACPEDEHGMLYTAVDGGRPSGRRVMTAAGCYQEYYRQLARAIVSGDPAPVTAEQGLDVIRIIADALRSHHERRTIPVAGK